MTYEEMVERYPQEQRGAGQDSIEQLPTHAYRSNSRSSAKQHDSSTTAATSADDDDDAGPDCNCSVCLQDLEDGDEIRTLPCMHMFHKECIDRWLTGNGICPVCRVPVTPN